MSSGALTPERIEKAAKHILSLTWREGNQEENETILAGLREQKENRWIPITERIPTEQDADHRGLIKAYSAELDQATVCVWHHILDDGVTSHWRPLPQPPEKGA